jgi:hypothetical protein
MSVAFETLPGGPSLLGSDGALVSVSISVDPRHLESLLEALANIEFPVNPQIYHDAAMIYVYSDRQESAPTTLVEFPSYAGRLGEVRRALAAYGFDPAEVFVTGMLDEIHATPAREPAPDGAPYRWRYRLKHRDTFALAARCGHERPLARAHGSGE